MKLFKIQRREKKRMRVMGGIPVGVNDGVRFGNIVRMRR